MTEISVESSPSAALVARVIKDVGTAIQPAGLERGLSRVTAELGADALREAAVRPPRRGGFAARVAAARMATVRIYGGISIRATATNGMHQLVGSDTGLIRHPVFGNPDVWVAQAITPGWFTDPMEAGRDDVVKALGGLLDATATKSARKVDSSG